MPNITISLTETENKAMEYAVASVQDWADNAVTNTSITINIISMPQLHGRFI